MKVRTILAGLRDLADRVAGWTSTRVSALVPKTRRPSEAGLPFNWQAPPEEHHEDRNRADM
jgi:hypothetical protein